MQKLDREWNKAAIWVGVIALLLVVGGASAAVFLNDDEPAPGAPAQSPSPEPSPTSASEPSEEPMEEACSADDLTDLSSDGERLPEAVSRTRDTIVTLALACDFDGLAALADPESFTFSFGGGEDPAEYWRSVDAEEEVMAKLVQILGMSHGVQGDTGGGEPIYAWPAVFLDEPTDAEWDEVLAIYSDEEIEQMKSFGGYIGYRTGITESGEWIFYVAGD